MSLCFFWVFRTFRNPQHACELIHDLAEIPRREFSKREGAAAVQPAEFDLLDLHAVHVVVAVDEHAGEMQLCGEYVYFQNKTKGGFLEKIRVDKADRSTVLNEMVSPICYSDGTIYYTGVLSDHSLHALDTRAGDRIYDILPGNIFFPVVNGGYIYYMNGQSNYSLFRTNMYSGETEIVTSERLDNFTMNDRYIYYTYSNGLLSQLKRCDHDGSNQVVLYQGVTNSLNLTSRYLYFKVYGNDDVMYHIPLDGSQGASVVTF